MVDGTTLSEAGTIRSLVRLEVRVSMGGKQVQGSVNVLD